MPFKPNDAIWEPPPEHFFHLEKLPAVEDVTAAAARMAAAYFRDPENLTGLSGSVLLPLMVSRGRPMPFIPWLLIAVMGDAAGRLAWRSYKNLETIAQAIGHDTEPVPEYCEEPSHDDYGRSGCKECIRASA